MAYNSVGSPADVYRFRFLGSHHETVPEIQSFTIGIRSEPWIMLSAPILLSSAVLYIDE